VIAAPAFPGMALALEETRPVFQGIHLDGKVIFYVLSILAILMFSYGWWRRFAKYRRGRPAGRYASIWRGLVSSPFGSRDTRRALGSLVEINTNATVMRRHRATGLAHFAIFWGFITLFVGTVILTIDYDVVRNAGKLLVGHEVSFYKGTFYLVYSVILDTMGLAAVLGLTYMAIRRAIARPRQLDYARAERPHEGYSRAEFVLGDWLFIGLLGAVLVTGFLMEGLRIRGAGFPAYEVWSPVGWLVARAVSGLGLSAALSTSAHLATWWIHAALALAFVVYIPFSKAMHMITDGFNLLAHDPTSPRHLPAPRAGSPSIGYRSISDFTWKELLDLDACTKCGRCHVRCPAQLSGAPLSPRDLILDLRQWADSIAGGATLLDHERRPDAPIVIAAGGEARLVGDVIKDETLWSCTTCGACVEACPVGIEHVPTIVELRRSLVEEGRMEPTLQQALQNLAQQGNSFGKSSRMRARWTKELGFVVKDARKEPVRYLWFVGDYASFDERLQGLSRTLARVLHDAGVDFGLLFEDEWNSGNDVRRVGEEGLFEMLVEHNVEVLARARFEEVFTTDPHSLNTLRNEYPDFGATYPVMHYTELLAGLIESGTIPVAPLQRRVTYHDPCYLARYNDVTGAPRAILEALGCELIEMPRNRQNALCCGAGGGRIWMDDSSLVERPSESRIREAAALGVNPFVVSCPKDVTMYSDAAKTTGFDSSLGVVDVVQLVDEAFDRSRLDADVGG
jgi:Fe-S oxidoreductase/nitrate reductase gamma subunit